MTGLIVGVVLVCELQSATWETVRSTRNGSWSNVILIIELPIIHNMKCAVPIAF